MELHYHRTSGGDQYCDTPTTSTPGPWGYGQLGNDADQWAVYDETGRDICVVYHGEANAALIAAAPELEQQRDELRAALKMAVDSLEDARDFILRFDDSDEGEIAASKAISDALRELSKAISTC